MPRPAKNAAAADAAAEGQPGAAAGTINGVIPTANDIKFIFAFIGNLKSKPEVNWDELAATMGMGGKKSASERWRLMRHKFNITLAEEGAAAGEGPGSARKGGKKATPAKGAKKAGNSGDDDEDIDDDEPKSAPVTPAKRGRKPSATSAAGKKRAALAAAAAAAAAAANAPGGGGSSAAEEDEDMGSPAKKAKFKAVEDSPMSSVPGMTADEDSGDEMAV